MVQIVLIGIAAGAASALLFSSVISGNALSVILFYLSALPIMLAGIAWSHPAALIAVAVGGISLGVVLTGWIALVYLIAVGVPAYILAYLAMLARPVPAENGAAAPAFEWYPVGRLVVWAALIGAALTIGTILQFSTNFEIYKTELRTTFERVLKMQARIPADQPLKLPGIENPGQFLDMLVAVMPPAAAALSMITSLFNLWLAGRVARASSRLRRPWPAFSEISFPPTTLALLAVASVVSFFPGMAGFSAAIVIAVLTLAYAILGFAVLHTITRRIGARIWVLLAAWLSVMIFGWPLVFVALLGVADAFFDLRGRFAPRAPPSPPLQRN